MQPWRDRPTDGRADQAQDNSAAATSATSAALASLPRPGRFPEPPPEREGGGREGEEVGGKGREAAAPPSLVLGVSPAPVHKNLRQVFQMQEEGAGASKLLSAHGIVLRGDPLAADLGARKGSLWQHYPNT